jgi:FAD/FMN-containing dehydrogenase
MMVAVIAERTSGKNGASAIVDEAEIEALAAAMRGPVIRPGDDEYDAARRVWNGMIDRYPAVIARCTGTADVVAAVNWARRYELPVAVRGGGHNVAGNAVNDGGLVIDLSAMKGIHVDPVKRTARAQGGATWGDLDHATQLYGLATPGGEVSMTGIAGYTLSGGMGFLHRKWGLACDNLLAAEVVTASGEVLQASAVENPDLYWALRGGGGNFGIVTWFEFGLHPLGPEIYSATVIYSADDAPRLLRSWKAFMEQAPDEITSGFYFWSLPPFPDLPKELHGTPIVIVAGLYAGPAGAGERALQPVQTWGEPILDLSGVSTYAAAQSAFDANFPDTQRYYWKSIFLDVLDEDTIDAIVAVGASSPTPQTLIALRQFGGAVGQLPEDATAYPHRRARYNLSLDATWADPADDQRAIAWTRHAWQGMRDRTGGGVYLNFAGLGEDNDALARAGYGGNYERLRQIKAKYDPDNFFRGKINIRP